MSLALVETINASSKLAFAIFEHMTRVWALIASLYRDKLIRLVQIVEIIALIWCYEMH